MIKICTKCNVEKLLGDFYLRKDTGSYRNVCKQCCVIKSKHWSVRNIEKVKNNQRQWRDNNAEKILCFNKQYYARNKETEKANAKIRWRNNRERNLFTKKLRYERNKKAINSANTKYQQLRCQNDIIFKLSRIIRGRLNKALKGKYKISSAVRDLGCTIDELKLYLESLFQEGMSWQNYGRTGWHIDHIKPLSSFDLTKREELLKVCHYSNLQPLWAKDNLSKGAKIAA